MNKPAGWLWACLILIVAAGAALRLGYFFNGDPFVDEWATMLVARGIWERGLPFLPSGSFYGHGMLFSYVDALFLALLGWTPEVAQLPSLIAGLLTLPLTYALGRKLFAAPGTAPADGGQPSTQSKLGRIKRWRGEAAGLLAAALLAVDPIAILWAGRARAYTLLQILVLLAIWWLNRRQYLLFTLAFVGAVFAHAEAALLLPGFALGLLFLEGRSVLRQPRAWLVMAVCGAAAVLRFLIHRLITTGSGGGLLPVDSRPAFEPTWDIVDGFRLLGPFFSEPYRLVASVLFVVGLVFAVRAWRRRDRTSGYLLLYPVCLVTLALMLTVVGQSWKDPRYLFMLLPAFLILAGAATVDLLLSMADHAGIPSWLKAAVAVALVGLLLIAPLPEALDTTNKLEEGYGPTLAYVREHWQPPDGTTGGDRVAGWAVPAIAVELGQIDYFAMQIRHEEFIMQKDGSWVDRWAGAPLMDSVAQLQAALDEPGRLWFLTDEFRFRARYTPEFAQAIWDRMDPVYRYHNALAFVERPVREHAYHRDVQASFEQGLDLVGYDLEPASLEPGGTLTVTLHWQARDWIGGPYTTFVHLLDPGGQGVAEADGPPFQGLHATDHWLPGERLGDERRLTLPPDAPPGRYRLEVGWYDPVTLDRLPLVDGGDSLTLAYVPLGQGEVDEPGTTVNAPLGGEVALVGFDLWRDVEGQWNPLAAGESLRGGERVKVRLVWQALAEMDRDYTVFVHLEGPQDPFWAQHDGQPAGGEYPTSYWRQGELVADEHELVVREGVAGSAELLGGMYWLETMERLDQAVTLGRIEVKP